MAAISDYDAAVESLVSMGISHVDAIDCLKFGNNDLTVAADHYFSGNLEKTRNESQWDETAWSSERNGPNPSQSERSYPNNFRSGFNVHGADVLSPNIFNNDGTKSRPPSRTSIQRMDDNDPELAKALAASMQGVPQPTEFATQESGIVGNHSSPINPVFGPALPGKQYDPGAWALTTTTQTQEVLLDPVPKDRKREAGRPAFLKPSSSLGYVSGTVTILHAIPAARKALLCLNHVMEDYGHEEQWWNGQQQIRVPIIVDLENDTKRVSPNSEEMVQELQRLMAFLDRTTRAYGSVDGLDLPWASYREQVPDTPAVPEFFAAYQKAVEDITGSYDSMSPLVSRATQETEDEEYQESTVFEILDVVIPRTENLTIYSVIDQIVWGDEIEVVVEFGDVVCLNLREKTNLTIDIPVEIYLDRYTRSWLDTARALKKQIEEQEAKITNLEEQERKLKAYQRKGLVTNNANHVYEPKMLLQIAIAHLSTRMEKDGTDSSDDIPMESRPQRLDHVPYLKDILLKLEKKLAGLASSQAEARESLRRLRLSYTSPDDAALDRKPEQKYTLRGVCTDSKTTYVLSKGNSGMNTEASSNDQAEEKWWRISWSHVYGSSTHGWNEQPSVTFEVDAVVEEEVLRVASLSAKDAVLVYANDKALKPAPGATLPQSLKAFVERDNAAFKAEQETPGKKRHSNWLDDDDATTSPGTQPHQQGSPKRSSRRSSVTLSAEIPQVVHGQEIEMKDNSQQGAESSGQIVDSPPPREMEERGLVSPVIKAIQSDHFRAKAPESDDDMPDAEHVE